MAGWRSAAAAFQGGTQQINGMKGKRVRARSSLFSANLFDPINNRQETTTIQAGAIGFVTNPHGACLLVAFSKDGKPCPNLEALTRTHQFFVVIINEPTFKATFEIEQ